MCVCFLKLNIIVDRFISRNMKRLDKWRGNNPAWIKVSQEPVQNIGSLPRIPLEGDKQL